jgi:hypothetical protein
VTSLITVLLMAGIPVFIMAVVAAAFCVHMERSERRMKIRDAAAQQHRAIRNPKPVLLPPDINALIDDLLFLENDEHRAAARENIIEAFRALEERIESLEKERPQ